MRIVLICAAFLLARLARPVVPEYLSLPTLLLGVVLWIDKDRRSGREVMISVGGGLLCGLVIYKWG